ncbi:MAG: hypothetical protein M5U28_40835 [Sandaracinaceae bacterium]|nr:hypothetical protein [Sandaracinaceae bacterium]
MDALVAHDAAHESEHERVAADPTRLTKTRAGLVPGALRIEAVARVHPLTTASREHPEVLLVIEPEIDRGLAQEWLTHRTSVASPQETLSVSVRMRLLSPPALISGSPRMW